MKNSDVTKIRGKEALISELGYMPEFCDAKILELVFLSPADSGTELSILLHYIDMDLNRDMNVKIILHDVSDINLNALSAENVIDKLSINRVNEVDIIFEIEACAGLFGNCKCKIVDVELISSKSYSETVNQ